MIRISFVERAANANKPISFKCNVTGCEKVCVKNFSRLSLTNVI